MPLTNSLSHPAPHPVSLAQASTPLATALSHIPPRVEGYKVSGVRVLDDIDGDGIATTVDMMRGMIEGSAGHPVIAMDRDEILARCPQARTSAREYCRCAWEWVKSRMWFREDQAPLGAGLGYRADGQPEVDVVEILTWPTDMSNRHRQTGQRVPGDCDDFSMWVGSLLLARGIPYSLCVAAVDRHSPRYSHVYGVGWPDGERLALDASHGLWPGWEVPRIWEHVNPRKEYPVGRGIWSSPWTAGIVAGALTMAVVACADQSTTPAWERVQGVKGVVMAGVLTAALIAGMGFMARVGTVTGTGTVASKGELC